MEDSSQNPLFTKILSRSEPVSTLEEKIINLDYLYQAIECNRLDVIKKLVYLGVIIDSDFDRPHPIILAYTLEYHDIVSFLLSVASHDTIISLLHISAKKFGKGCELIKILQQRNEEYEVVRKAVVNMKEYYFGPQSEKTTQIPEKNINKEHSTKSSRSEEIILTPKAISTDSEYISMMRKWMSKYCDDLIIECLKTYQYRDNDYFHTILLYYAIKRNNINLVQVLIQVNVSIVTIDGYIHPVLYAYEQNRNSILLLLLKHIFPNAYEMLITIAIKQGKFDLLMLLINRKIVDNKMMIGKFSTNDFYEIIEKLSRLKSDTTIQKQMEIFINCNDKMLQKFRNYYQNRQFRQVVVRNPESKYGPLLMNSVIESEIDEKNFKDLQTKLLMEVIQNGELETLKNLANDIPNFDHLYHLYHGLSLLMNTLLLERSEINEKICQFLLSKDCGDPNEIVRPRAPISERNLEEDNFTCTTTSTSSSTSTSTSTSTTSSSTSTICTSIPEKGLIADDMKIIHLAVIRGYEKLLEDIISKYPDIIHDLICGGKICIIDLAVINKKFDMISLLVPLRVLHVCIFPEEIEKHCGTSRNTENLLEMKDDNDQEFQFSDEENQSDFDDEFDDFDFGDE